LGCAPAQLQRTGEIFAQLSRIVREALPILERDQLQQLVQDRRKEWEQSYASLAHHSAIEGANAELNQLFGEVEDFATERDLSCANLLAAVDRHFGRLEEEIRGKLDDAQIQAWGLGVCVDQGVRPPGVVRYVWRPHEGAPECSSDGAAWQRAPSSALRPVADNFLANREIGPGEIPWMPSWQEDLRQRWREMSNSVACPDDLNLPAEVSSQTIHDVVSQLDGTIRRILDELRGQAPDGQESVAGPPVKRDGATESRDAWIYQQCCEGVPYKTIIAELNRKKCWVAIESIQGIRDAAKRFATRNGKPLPPARRAR
jgi:hypothetical protein